MSCLIKKHGNIAIVQYDLGAKSPTFDFDNKGVLFITGYIFYMGFYVRAAKRYETGLLEYNLAGQYHLNKHLIHFDTSNLIEGLDLDRCLIFTLC